MAPFKLKFRMGGSRSTSQETETEQPSSQQLLLSNVTLAMNGSSTTIDSDHITDSFGSLNSDERALIQSNDYGNQIGYSNPTIIHNYTEPNRIMPLSPPPSYEDVLEENRLAQLIVDCENNTTTAINTTVNCPQNQQDLQNIHLDDECLQQIHLSEIQERSAPSSRQNSIDGHLYSCSTMTTPSQENLLECTGGSCDPLFGSQSDQHSLVESTMMDEHIGQHQCDEIADDDIGHLNMAQADHNSADECNWDNEQQQHAEYDQSNYEQSNYDQQSNYDHTQYDQAAYDQQTNSYDQSSPNEINEYIDNKSSKEMYKAAAKKWGITCKMSDQCRCMECQSHYFDCEYEENEHQKTDGGLGAGTPMFISEVMHGSACTIL